jgi:AcrR family transcriptional regulator
VIVTPWGRSDELRARKLSPGPGTSREQVEINQRERLFAAMVAAIAEHGYEKTRVADVLELSGISRNTFYKHFRNKQSCFVATLDAAAAIGSEGVVDAYLSAEGSWHERLHAAVARLTELILEHPEVARLYYVESYAAGSQAVERMDLAGDRFEELARQAFDQSPERADMPRDLVRAVLRGFRHVLQARLRTGREGELVELAPQLLDWVLSYRTPPERLRRPRKPPARFDPPPVAKPENARERILTAVIELVSENGYDGLVVTKIAERAAVSLTTFYAEFGNKEDAILRALRLASRQVFDVTTPAYRAGADWQHGVGDAVHAFFAYLSQEPTFARFGGVEMLLSSPLVVDVRSQLLAGAQVFLAEGYRHHPGVSPVAGEAIGATIDAMLFDHVRRNSGQSLYELAPTAAFVALAPFLGPDEACAIANASR